MERSAASSTGCTGGDATDAAEMAAAYLFHLVRNHPSVDGNERTGAMASFVLLAPDGIWPIAPERSFERIVRSIAETSADKAAVAAFLRKHADAGPSRSGP